MQVGARHFGSVLSAWDEEEQLKVLPVEDEVKQIDPNEKIVRHLSGAVGDALEPEVPDTDLVAPLKNDSLPDIIAIGDPGFLDKPMVKKSQQQPSRDAPSSSPNASSGKYQLTRGATLKRVGTSQRLLNNSPNKAAMLANQSALIEKRKQPGKHSTIDRFAYFIDQYISTRKGQTLTLGCMGLVLTLIGGCVLKASQPKTLFSEKIWESWTYLAAPRAHTGLTKA
ncbi:putative Ion channel, partial [Globisporangium polare]